MAAIGPYSLVIKREIFSVKWTDAHFGALMFSMAYSWAGFVGLLVGLIAKHERLQVEILLKTDGACPGVTSHWTGEVSSSGDSASWKKWHCSIKRSNSDGLYPP